MIRWSKLSGKVTQSVDNTIAYLQGEGYVVVGVKSDSPVGKVPHGSIVLTDVGGRRAIWFLGKIYQKPAGKSKMKLNLPNERN